MLCLSRYKIVRLMVLGKPLLACSMFREETSISPSWWRKHWGGGGGLDQLRVQNQSGVMDQEDAICMGESQVQISAVKWV